MYKKFLKDGKLEKLNYNEKKFSKQTVFLLEKLEALLCFLPQVEWTPRCPDSKEGRFPCSGLNAGPYFISQDEGM